MKTASIKTSKLAGRGASDQLADMLKPGQSIALLQALHIVTREGGINQDSRRKLKQVLHLAQFIEPLIHACFTDRVPGRKLRIVDHGAGKAYLGFILYDLYLKPWVTEPGVEVWGIENREDLVVKARELAQQLGFSAMQFMHIDTASAVQAAQLNGPIDIVTALHACDTATDDALAFAIQRKSQHVVLVPCCQAEVAQQLRAYKKVMLGKTALSELWRHPIHTREVGAQITNVLRCLALEVAGYSVTVTELVGWEHSMKNELIIASLKPDATHSRERKQALARLEELLETFGLQSMRSRFIPLTI